MVNQGISVRAHTDCDINYIASSGSPGTQIKFTDAPDDEEVLRRIEKIKVPQIFESFHRGNNADKVQGNGLGLFICKRMMSLMGGEVSADIRNGCFFVTLVVKLA